MENKIILLINEANSQDTDVLKKKLLDNGYTVILKPVDDNPGTPTAYDAIVVRMVNTGKDDIRRLVEIHERYAKRKTPLILLASDYDPEFYLRCLERGFVNCINVPCCERELFTKISDIINRGISRRQGRKIRLGFDYRKNTYDITLYKKQMEDYIASPMSENSAAKQNRMLLNYMDKYSSINFSCGTPPLVETPAAHEHNNKLLLNDINRGLNNSEFRLYYQPVISLGDNSLKGFESLIRWNHPSRGLVPPDEFIPVAEKSEIIIPLGQWIIGEAVEQLAR